MSEKLPKMPELKSCPFCGGDAGWWGNVPCCNRCSAMGPTDGIDDTREDMAQKWNRRSLQRETWMRAMEVAAESCASVLDLKEEARALQASRDASGTDEELSRLQHWATVSTYNAGVRRCAAAIRALPMPEGGE
jgi:hypothetical protein